MIFIEWTKEEDVNIKIVDDQHKILVAILNDLHSTLGTDHNNYAKERTFTFLKELRLHFNTEEAMMKENSCPYYISHKMEHDRFYSKFESFHLNLEQGKEKVNLELLNSIKKWLYNHIELNDRKFANYILEKGAV